ncbi:MAG: glutathione S-transferase family protein [Candidatus Binataceae bacterium]
MIKLWEHPLSPYVHKVKIALYEKNIPFEVGTPQAFTGAPTDYGKANPRLEVPALVDDGFAIFDSTIILDYIEDKWPTPALAPKVARERARVRMIEELCDSYYEAINWGMMEILTWRRASGAAADIIVARAHGQIDGVHAWLERELELRAYFNGDAFGYGDLCVWPFVKGSEKFGHSPKAGSKLARWLLEADRRESTRKSLAAAQEFLASATAASLPDLLASGAFKRQYRDHRLEWMIRSGGIDLVVEGMRKATVRFSEEIA